MQKIRSVGIAVILLLTLPLVCFGKDELSDVVSDSKIQELTQYLNEHQEILQQAEEQYDELLKMEDDSEMPSASLDNLGIPGMLQVFYSLSGGYSPEMWDDIITAEESAQYYFKFLKDSNPIVRLHGLILLQEIEKLVKNPEEWQTSDDISTGKKTIELVKAGYFPSNEDQSLFEQYEKCFAYFEPILTKKEETLDIPRLIAVFETADPAVQFYLTFQISWAAMWGDNEQLKQVLIRLGYKGDVYTKGLVAISLMDKDKTSQLLRNSTTPDEFITLAGFLNSRNVKVPLEAWPDKETLDTFFSKASPAKRGQMLQLMKGTVERVQLEQRITLPKTKELFQE